MLKHLPFRRRLHADQRDEILSIRHAMQIDALALSPHLRRDIGLDDTAAAPDRRRRP